MAALDGLGRAAARALAVSTLAMALVACSTGAPSPLAQATPPPASPSPDPLAAVQSTMDQLKATHLIAEIPVVGGCCPQWQVSAFGSVWIAVRNPGSVAVSSVIDRIDEKSNHVVATVPVALPCLDLAAGFGSIWAPNCQARQVDRIDPNTNRVVATIPVSGLVSNGDGQLLAAFGSVWLFVDGAGTLARIDPATNRVASTTAVGTGGVAIVATSTALWASEYNSSDVLEMTSAGVAVRTIPVSLGPRRIAAGEGGVWVLGQSFGDVTRIDPTTGQVVATIRLAIPGGGGCIATGGGAVWVSMAGTPLSKIDAATNTVLAQYTGPGGDCIGFADGSVWLSNNDLSSVWRLRP